MYLAPEEIRTVEIATEAAINSLKPNQDIKDSGDLIEEDDDTEVLPDVEYKNDEDGIIKDKEELNDGTDKECPGSSLGSCIGVCVYIPNVRVYGACVRDCARRCP